MRPSPTATSGRLDAAHGRTRGRTAAGTGSLRAGGRAAAARPGSTRSAPRDRRGPASPRTAAACTDAAGRGRARRPAPARRSRPAYMTTPRSHSCATTGRSCVTRTSASPSSRQSASSSSRICACTITSSAVVGSSAISTFGLHESAIAIAARWRIPPDSSCGKRPARAARDPDRLEQLAASRAARPRRARVPCSSIASTICAPTVRTGFSAFIAPWKTIAMSTQRCGPDRRLAAREHVLALEQHAARGARGRRQEPHDRERRRRLAAAGLADEPEPLAAARARSSTPCTACSSPPSGEVEPHVEVVDLQQRRRSQRVRSGRRAAAAGTCAPRGARRAGAGSAHPRARRRRGCRRG